MVFQDAVQSTEAVLPVDLLPFSVSPAEVCALPLIDPDPFPRNLDSDSRLESEPGFFDDDRLDDLPAVAIDIPI